MLGRRKYVYHVPMISFCDIPLSEVKEHVSKYGNYGIGLTKKWGVGKGLNPVLYVSQNSMLASSYRAAFSHYNLKPIEDIDDWTKEQRSLADVLRYIKNYEANLLRKGSITKNYRFSDEREWRFVPAHSEDCDMFLDHKYYDEPPHKEEADAKLTKFRLKFEPNDIKYIIINDDTEISEFVDHLRRAKGNNYFLHDIERLTTRILTTEQIKGDM